MAVEFRKMDADKKSDLLKLIYSDINRIADEVPSEETAANASFFITGGTGGVGMWLVRLLLFISDRRGWNINITLLTRNISAFVTREPDISERLRFVQGDVSNFIFPDRDYEYIIHAATETDVKKNESDPLSLLSSIADGTKRVLEFAAKCRCGKMLYVSSGAVYNKNQSDMSHIPENYLCAPDISESPCSSAYGEGKRYAELLCMLHAKFYGLDVKIVRLFASYGPYSALNESFAIGNFIRDALRGVDISISGDGTPQRSYIYLADVALWFISILFKGKTASPYNVGSESAISIEDLAEKVKSILNPNCNVIIAGLRKSPPLPSPPLPGIQVYVPFTGKARHDLNLKEHFTLEEGIRKMSIYGRAII
jgi:dTDP-glucose 4,6-dehydratase